jgi:hypothetical protein
MLPLLGFCGLVAHMSVWASTYLDIVWDVGRIPGPVVDVCSARPVLSAPEHNHSENSLFIVSPHGIPPTTIVVEFLTETSNSISLVSAHVDSTTRISIDPSITSDLSYLSKLVLRCQLACSLNME